MVVQLHRYIVQFLVLLLSGILIVLFQLPDNNLRVIACDVGQGDAILITYKSTQILTDGGPNNKVVECLGKYIPFYDRTLELVILTHPDADHSTGLIEVFKRYKVDTFLENDLEVSTQVYKVLKNQVGSSGAKVINPTNDMKLRLGLMQLDLLWPLATTQNLKTNDMGIVTLLTYGQFNALFTADTENEVSDQISKNFKVKDLEYIKVNHHGSKNGLSQALLDAVDPEIAVISVGRNNRYGHPHEEILKMLSKAWPASPVKNSNALILRTDEMGDIEVITDGERYWVRD